MRIRYAATYVTISRIIGTIILLLIEPLSISFYFIYTLCGVSDALDGYIARKTNTTSMLGEILDSTADFIFVFAALYIFIPLFDLEYWMLYWTGGIVLARFGSSLFGLLKYRTAPF